MPYAKPGLGPGKNPIAPEMYNASYLGYKRQSKLGVEFLRIGAPQGWVEHVDTLMPCILVEDVFVAPHNYIQWMACRTHSFMCSSPGVERSHSPTGANDFRSKYIKVIS